MIRGERFNGISHLLGAAAAVAGTAVLVVLAARTGDPWRIVSVSLYGATLVFLYVSSTLYHSLRGRAKAVFRRLDHHAIYGLIVGTYLPFTLVTLRGTWGWWLLGAVIGLAALGTGIEYLPRRGERVAPVVIYLAMGLLALAALAPLRRALGAAGFDWLLAGGLFYIAGIVFYALDGRWRHAHGVWHLFVVAGSVSHYLVILLRVA